MSALPHLSRRRLLGASAFAAGGLLLWYPLAKGLPEAAAAEGASPFGVWLRIAPSGEVTVTVPIVEVGQGTSTALPMILAEELDADWSKVRFAFAPVAAPYMNPAYAEQLTGGSTGVSHNFQRYREAGATARAMLIAAAARAWSLSPEACSAREGLVEGGQAGQRLTYGELAEAAAREPVPPVPPLKEPREFRLIGRPVPRLDIPSKTDGSAVFGIDLRTPGILTAAVANCPVFGGSVAGYDRAEALAQGGVRHVAKLPDGLAVLADTYWQARKGLRAAKIRWDEGGNRQLTSEDISRRLHAAVDASGIVVEKKGDPDRAFAAAGSRMLEARYEWPLLAHATMEPVAASARVTAKGADIWGSIQQPAWVREEVSKLTGLPEESVRVHDMLAGGAFGRRMGVEFPLLAVRIAMQAEGRPVKVVRTREDDIQHDFYRPPGVSRVRAALDGQGRPVAWQHVLASPAPLANVFPKLLKDDHDLSETDGSVPFYVIPDQETRYVRTEVGVPTGAWRSVGASHNAFVVESFIDELAHAGGQDPYLYRRKLLGGRDRFAAVLDRAAEAIGWGDPPSPGRALGISIDHKRFDCIVSTAAEVSLEGGRPKVHRLVIVADPGFVVHPDAATAQLEGGAVFGLTALMHGEITVRGGRVVQGNFHDYRMLRLGEIPPIEVILAPSGAPMQGVSEGGVPGVAPAVCNALFALTGQRIRRLPLARHSFTSTGGTLSGERT